MKILLLASEWQSKRDLLSTFSGELAIQLAKCSDVQVSVFVPGCNQEEKDAALMNHITLIQPTRRLGCDDETTWLYLPPIDLPIDCVIGHGVVLGHPAQVIQENRDCIWVQFVHTDPEELGMFKFYPCAMSKAEMMHRDELTLCAMADLVVAVGSKVAETCGFYLRCIDKNVLSFTPGIFSEFYNVAKNKQERGTFQVLVFVCGDAGDFSVKGFDIAAKAVGRLKDAHFIFVGVPGKKQDEVASHLKKCNIPPGCLRVNTCIETRECLKQLFSEVDLAIMPSRVEGFGITALEALSAGLPILVSCNSGFAEALKKVQLGSQCVIDSDDAEEWTDRITEVWSKDRELRLEEARDIRNNYGKKYSWERQCSVLVEKLQSMLNDKQAKDQGLQDNSEHEMETTCPVLKPDDEISAGEHMSEDAVKDKHAKDPGLQDNSEHEMETTCSVLKPDDEMAAGEHMSEDIVKGEFWSCRGCKETLTKFHKRWQCSKEHTTCDYCVFDQWWDTSSHRCLDEHCAEPVNPLPSFNTEKEVVYVFVDEVIGKDTGHLIDTVVGDREFAMATLYGYKPGSSDNICDKFSEHGRTLVLKMSPGTVLISDIVSLVSGRGVKKGTTVVVNGDSYMIPAITVGLKKNWRFEIWMWNNRDSVEIRKLEQESSHQLKICSLDEILR